MAQCIEISEKLKNTLEKYRNNPHESYAEIVERILEMLDDNILDPATIKNIAEGMADIDAGRVYTTEQLKKKLNLE